MQKARNAMFRARAARILHDALEADGDPESYDLRIKLGEYVEWVIDQLFIIGDLDHDELRIVTDFIENDTVEEAAEKHGCSTVWWGRIYKETCNKINKAMEGASV